MTDSGELVLQMCPPPGDDAGELAKLARWLRNELLDLDVAGVEHRRGKLRLQAPRAQLRSLSGYWCNWAQRRCGRCWLRWPTG